MFAEGCRSKVEQYQGKSLRLRQIKRLYEFCQLSFGHFISPFYKIRGLGMINTMKNDEVDGVRN